MKKLLALALAAALGAALAAGGAKPARRVSADGSTSMERVIGTLGEAFMEIDPGVAFTYNPTGSSSGVAAVREGRCDIGLSSRALKEEEKASGLSETVLAYDGIALVVNPSNPVNGLTLEQIADLYTGAIANWSGVGGRDAPVVLIGREAGSGTRDGFETACGVAGRCAYRQELTSNGDVTAAVNGNPDAVGYVSLAAARESVKVLSVDGAVPTAASVKDGDYPVARPFVLVTRAGDGLSAPARRFFDFATSAEAAKLIALAGAVAAK